MTAPPSDEPAEHGETDAPGEPAGENVAPEAEEPAETRRTNRAAGRRAAAFWSSRRRILVLGGAVAVLVVVAVTLLLTQQRGPSEPITVVTTTVAVPAPTPEQDPIERDTSTELLAALPDTVLQYAVSEQIESERMLELDALEGWRLTYASADDAVVLSVGQWPTTEEATEAAAALLEDATPIDEGDVLVDGEPVGTFTTSAADDATERTIWTNSTVVFVVRGATGTTHTFYDAFGF